MSSQLDYYTFMGFDSNELRRRYAGYADQFQSGTAVLDIGCGRGEFLELLKERGVNGVGVDADPEMVGEVTKKGLTAVHADGVAYLNDNRERFDGIFASHLVEHLTPPQLERMIEASAQALRPQGRAIFVTPNPANLQMQLGDFWIDLQHVRFYSPLIVRYILHRAGFRDIEIGYSEVFRMGPELSYQHIPPFNDARAQRRWGPSDPVRKSLQAPSTSRRIEQLEQRVYDLMTWMQSLYPPAEYFVTGIR